MGGRRGGGGGSGVSASGGAGVRREVEWRVRGGFAARVAVVAGRMCGGILREAGVAAGTLLAPKNQLENRRFRSSSRGGKGDGDERVAENASAFYEPLEDTVEFIYIF